jgi:hypothetical protein
MIPGQSFWGPPLRWRCPRCGNQFLSPAGSGQLMLCGCGGGVNGVTAMALVAEDYDAFLFDCGDFKIRVLPSWD